MTISKKVAKEVGDKIGIDWKKIDLEQFHMGMNVEMEHGTKLGKKTNVTKNDLIKTGKIALAHLLELPNYYTRLKKIETNDKKPKKESVMKITKSQLMEIIKKTVKEQIEMPDENIELSVPKSFFEDLKWKIESIQEVLRQSGRDFENERDPYGPWVSNPFEDALEKLKDVNGEIEKILQ